MNEIFENLYDMTAFSNIIAEPQFLIMYAIAFVLLYLGIKKQYEPLLLVPIAFGVLLANFPRRRYGSDTGRREWYGDDKRCDEEYLGNAFA